jgi:hypothetical protein
VFGVVSLVGSITAPAQPEASGNARDVILAAYDSNADSIMHITMTQHNNGQLVLSLDDWYSSAQTKPGQALTHREIMGPPDVRQDSSETFVVPTVGPRPPGCRAVPGASGNRVGELLAVDGRDLNVDYGSKTWYEDKDVCMLWGQERPEQLRDEIAAGQWQRVPGETTVDGQRAIEYTKVLIGDKSKGVGDVHTGLWINADSNLPIRMELKGYDMTGTTIAHDETDDYAFLPNTVANRENLGVPIPAGFNQVQGPHFGMPVN